MAILQPERDIPLELITDPPIEGTVKKDLLTRTFRLEFPHPSEKNHVIVIQSHVGGANKRPVKQVAIHFTGERQPGKPEEDVKDPVTGEVVVSANSIQTPLPSVADLHKMRLPKPVKVETYGDLFNVTRRAIYLLLPKIRPHLKGGQEV